MNLRSLPLQKVALVLACAFVFITAGCRKPPANAALAQVVRIEGTVEVHRGAKAQPATPPSPLFSEDEVSTGVASTALLRYQDGRELSVFEKTRFRLTESPGRLMVTLQEGTVLTVARPGQPAGTRLSIVTPAGEAEVIQGAELKFVVGGGQASMTVLLGETTVLSADGNPMTVVAGETLDLALKRIQPREDVHAQELTFVLKTQKGEPTVRQPSEPAFTSVGAAKSLGTGAAFLLPDGSEAELSTTGVRFQLFGKTHGEAGKISRDAQGRKYSVSLESGQAQVAFEGDGLKTLALGTPQGSLDLKASVASAARVEVGPDGAVIQVQVGAFTLVRDGATHVIKAGEQLTVSAQNVQVAPQPSRAWVLPLSQNVRVYSEELPEVRLALPAGLPQERLVEIARDAQFQDTILAGKTDQPHLVLRPPSRGTLHWRVSTEGAPALTGQAVFDQDNGRSSMRKDSPRAEVTESGLKATVFFQSAPPALTLRFSPREGAVKYRVQVFKAQNLDTPVLERTVTDTVCTLKAGALGEGQYVWYAQGVDARGGELPGGRMNKLHLVYDNSRKMLAILKPSPHARVRTVMIETAGVAPLGSKLFVNDTFAPLDGKGRFGLRVPRAEVLVFRLVSQTGDESFWLRRVQERVDLR